MTTEQPYLNEISARSYQEHQGKSAVKRKRQARRQDGRQRHWLCGRKRKKRNTNTGFERYHSTYDRDVVRWVKDSWQKESSIFSTTFHSAHSRGKQCGCFLQMTGLPFWLYCTACRACRVPHPISTKIGLQRHEGLGFQNRLWLCHVGQESITQANHSSIFNW